MIRGELHGELHGLQFYNEKKSEGVQKTIFLLILEETSSLQLASSVPPPHGWGSFLVLTWSDWCCHGAIEIVKRWIGPHVLKDGKSSQVLM